MTNEKEFPLGAVLSILLDKILVTRISEVRLLCSFLTGKEVYSNQISRAAKEVLPALAEQFPQFKDLNRDEITPQNAKVWLEKQEQKFGNTVTVKQITDMKFDFSDPVGDLRSPRKIIVFKK